MLIRFFTFYCEGCKKDVLLDTRRYDIVENYDFIKEVYTCESICPYCGEELCSQRKMDTFDTYKG